VKDLLMTLFPKERSIRWITLFGFVVGFLLFVYSLQWQLNGPHQHRQADSVYPGFFYCFDSDSRFLYPRVGPRGLSDGVAINEFPIYAYSVGQICKLKGSWDESTPRIFSMIMAFLAACFFWLILQRKYHAAPESKSGLSFLEYLLIFFFLPVNWTFFTIPMPESTALFLNALAGYLWIYFPDSKIKKVLAFLIFCTSFLIRPFYILLLLFYFPGLLIVGTTIVVCIALFWGWYRYWSGLVTTMPPGYFGIQFQTKAEVIASLPRAIAHLPVRVLEHTAVVGIFSMFMMWRREMLLVLFYVASLLMMYVLKSTHVSAHGYYLLNAGVFASFIIYLSLQYLTKTQRQAFLVFFLLYTFTSTQHNFMRNGHETELQVALQDFEAKSHQILPAEAKVATYLGLTPEWVYYLKRTGFIFEPLEFKGSAHCPLGATHYLARKGTSGGNYDEKASLELGACQFLPSPITK